MGTHAPADVVVGCLYVPAPEKISSPSSSASRGCCCGFSTARTNTVPVLKNLAEFHAAISAELYGPNSGALSSKLHLYIHCLLVCGGCQATGASATSTVAAVGPTAAVGTGMLES